MNLNNLKIYLEPKDLFKLKLLYVYEHVSNSCWSRTFPTTSKPDFLDEDCEVPLKRVSYSFSNC